ncbi:hypothetical protein [Methanosarcina sp. WH1]|uniref:hypothetical protein n=1 Tax=Methanosarcina sp. WH1 TaxID=1434102 RepID=UPI00064EE02C|nr:hypothetical protein [Methanosarcina sp. WH1]
MGFFGWLDRLLHPRGKKHRHHKRKSRVRIAYLVCVERSGYQREHADYTFWSGRKAHNYAKKLCRKTKTAINVYKVNIDNYSFGDGDTFDIHRYGIFKEWTYEWKAAGVYAS